ncbi:pyrroline-5-carboxylate reductase [Ferrovum sp. PN-J185]|uniref:pyrroline-5-carboxylate reductase n=1 Tax=Ferrovum sp. PN-J185 TaxID=1356306 RepID=UPI001E50E62D|nr:pyrroline-5-carboxylate reductase [Ferrovum sp. PN-J185]MCC6068910.1 pyrroline-5-carboxylate reductase [Ferrovum sp. PN-J185]
MTIAFIGGGNMARALIGGLINHGQSVEDIVVVEIDQGAATTLQQDYSLTVIPSVEHLSLEQVTTVVLAVKPQQLAEVARGITGLYPELRVVSIAAGITTKALSQWLGGHTNIVRAMPNTPALIQEGISGLYALPQVSEEDRLHAQSLLTAVGSVIWVDKEADLDAVTAVSGSGPAYFFWMMEEMEKIAVALGLSEDVAKKLVLQTALGSTQLAHRSQDNLSTLRQKVTSKGGTTEAALNVLQAEHAGELLKKALFAARDKAQELGHILSQQ